MKRTVTMWPLLALAIAAAMLLAWQSPAFAIHQDVALLNATGGPVAPDEPYSPKQTCGGCHDYGSGVEMVTKHQGRISSATGNIIFDTYEVASFANGVSVGRHMEQGRNEAYSSGMRGAFGDPFFTSSPGMWGKY